MVEERNRSYHKFVFSNSENNWNNYKNTRNKVTSSCRQAKIAYFEKTIDSCKNDSRQMWKTLKKFISGARSETYDNLKCNEVKINTDQVAEKFNEFYVKSIDEVIDSMPQNFEIGSDIVPEKSNR